MAAAQTHRLVMCGLAAACLTAKAAWCMLPHMTTSPYIVSNWVAGSHFYGREELCQALSAPTERCIYLVGTRRVGKTSLLKRLAAMGSPHTLYCDLMQAADHDGQQATIDEGRLVRLLRRELGRQAPASEPLRASQSLWDRGETRLCAWLEEL